MAPEVAKNTFNAEANTQLAVTDVTSTPLSPLKQESIMMMMVHGAIHTRTTFLQLSHQRFSYPKYIFRDVSS